MLRTGGGLSSFTPRLTRRAWVGRWGGRPVGSLTQSDGHKLLDREWLLKDPAVPVSWVQEGAASLAVVRDDLTHPYLGGNKIRKLDGLWPQLRHSTDVVTCGGLQSAHTTAVAAVCAEHGIRAHLLVRGERPEVPTGHHLFTRMLGTVNYVSRAEYADRGAMLAKYAEQLELLGGRRIAVIPEGAARPEALLGTIRLVRWLSSQSELAERECHIVVDSGTGATATGLALGAVLYDLPWRITGVMLAGAPAYYGEQQRSLTEAFARQYAESSSTAVLQERASGMLQWVERPSPRKFGKVLPGEIARCRQIAQRHGILLDPIWSLAAWEVALALAEQSQHTAFHEFHISGDLPAKDSSRAVVMLHTGGMLGLCGLAQRYPAEF